MQFFVKTSENSGTKLFSNRTPYCLLITSKKQKPVMKALSIYCQKHRFLKNNIWKRGFKKLEKVIHFWHLIPLKDISPGSKVRAVLGAAIKRVAFKDLYVIEEIDKWVRDVTKLAEIAGDEPQLMYSSFTKVINHCWSYFQRIIPDIDHHFDLLE